jgi:hypothetical protein
MPRRVRKDPPYLPPFQPLPPLPAFGSVYVRGLTEKYFS